MIYDEYFCVGTYEEVQSFERKIDFGKDAGTALKYNSLIPAYKKIVYTVLSKLLDGNDFFGYNLRKILAGYKDAEPSVAQLVISRHLAEDSRRFSAVSDGEKNVDNRLNYAKKTIFLQKDTDVFRFAETICHYFLLDIDLLTKGIGKVQIWKDGWVKKYAEDKEFHANAEKDIKNNWNTRLRVEEYTKKLIDEKLIGEKETILEEKWAVMTYTGAFQAIDCYTKRKNEADAIRQLISSLYVQQYLDGKMPSLQHSDEE